MSQNRSRPDWWRLTEQHAATAGVDSELLAKVAGVESNFRNVDNQSGPGGTPTSSATGPFQIIESTWNGLATNHPRLGLTNRRDVNQQAMAAPYLFKEKLDTLRHLTKRSDVSAGEAYLAWFLGPKDAARVINAQGSTAIGSVVGAAALRANKPVFERKGREITTAEQLIAWADGKMGGAPSPRSGTQRYDQGPQFPRGETVDVSMSTPRSSISDSQRRALEDAQAEKAYGLAQGAGQAIWAENGVNWAFKALGAPPPDPTFTLTKERLAEVAEGVDQAYIPYLARAHSEENLEWRMKQLQSDLEIEQRLAAMGGTGVGLRILGALVDPVGWAAAAATGGLGIGAKAGRMAHIGIMAGQGAAANALTEIPQAMNKPTWTRDQLLYSVAAGSVMGAAVGGFLGRNTDLSEDVTALATSANNARKALAPQGDGSAGAMATPNRVEPVRGDTDAWMTSSFMEAQGQTKYSAIRFDSTNRLKSSENPIFRALGNRMGLDAVGNADKSMASGRALTEDKQIIADRMDMAYKETYWSTVNEFLDRHEIPGMSRKDAEAFFRTEVTRYMRSKDGLEEVDPAVKRMADKVAKINEDYLKLAQGDHRAIDGSMRKPIPGFEDVPINEAYVPRYTNFEKFRQMVGSYGDKQMSDMVYNAIRAMNPDASDAMARKIAKGYIKRLRSVDAGQEDVGGRMFATLDMEDMRAHLREIGLDDDEIEWALRRPAAKDAKKPGSARAERRTLFDEGFKMDMRRADGTIDKDVSIMDMFHDDNLYIFNRYNREMSGNIAMSRLRVENPNWREGEDDLHPKYLVDGIYSDSDWQTLLTKGRAVASDLDGKARATIEKDEAAANFLYDVIRGRPQMGDTGNGAQYMRMMRDFNFSRVMGQVGFAQLPDIGQHIGSLGVRVALKSIPGLRQLSRDIRTGKIKDADMDFLTHITGKGADFLRGKGRMMTDDQGVPISSTGSLKNRLEYALSRGARGTGVVSGMTPVMTFIQRWASQGAMWKIAEAAYGNTKLSRQRMNILGIDDKMQEAILQSIRDGNKRMGGRGKKGDLIEHMDLDNWDPQVRGAFEFAITRWSKRIAQDGDAGQSNAMLSSGPGKLLMQFRSFGINAWTMNTLHNIHMKDPETLMTILVSSIIAALTWQVQTHLRSIGREDKQAYLDENLSWGRTMAAGTGRIAFASLLPGMIDTALDLAPGLDPVFNVRSTGLSNAGLSSVPTGDVIKRSYDALQDIGEVATGQSDLTGAKFRNAFGLLMFQNTLPMMWMGNAISSELPKR
jgi:hypothetical protein